jgi:hypothetical protein
MRSAAARPPLPRLPLLAPLIGSTLFLPGAAEAAQQGAVSDHLMACMWTAGISTVLTVAMTSRFLMSLHPTLEKRARAPGGPLALRALCVMDPVLEPVKTKIFGLKDPEDPQYAAIAALALLSAALELMFGGAGGDGLLTAAVPDLGMLHYLQYLTFFQQMILIPQWALAVFRSFYVL